MRLIDADELRWTTLRDGFGRINTCIVFESDINAMPTVEAIPIEWIEKWNEEKCIKAINWMMEDWRKEDETD